MPRIAEQEIERLKTEISVQRLVEAAGIDLKKSGKDLLGRCPFHEDGEPSLVVTPAKNLWHCFACGISGGPIDRVMKASSVNVQVWLRLALLFIFDSAFSGSPPATKKQSFHFRLFRLLGPVLRQRDRRRLPTWRSARAATLPSSESS
jgi:hypothetical protein